ncbi:hypothetical protein B0T24DRAFT_25771 [Lasiosphaeria ovina]|uniref:Uncharacterized protein n=1 Tax=Lasiosphaeria ovina TaxID=92902 RepID=A0AAE0NJT7_9PEZI|nr:hypothetical protein B0T24DRAFT_25771 [Lasiosphaeria ovina]
MAIKGLRDKPRPPVPHARIWRVQSFAVSIGKLRDPEHGVPSPIGRGHIWAEKCALAEKLPSWRVLKRPIDADEINAGWVLGELEGSLISVWWCLTAASYDLHARQVFRLPSSFETRTAVEDWTRRTSPTQRRPSRSLLTWQPAEVTSTTCKVRGWPSINAVIFWMVPRRGVEWDSRGSGGRRNRDGNEVTTLGIWMHLSCPRPGTDRPVSQFEADVGSRYLHAMRSVRSGLAGCARTTSRP